MVEVSRIGRRSEVYMVKLSEDPDSAKLFKVDFEGDQVVSVSFSQEWRHWREVSLGAFELRMLQVLLESLRREGYKLSGEAES